MRGLEIAELLLLAALWGGSFLCYANCGTRTRSSLAD
jgi:hypothetical protein